MTRRNRAILDTAALGILFFTALTALLCAEPLRADGSVDDFQYEAALKASQAAIGRQLSDWPFTDAQGRMLSLADLRGKPLVLSLVFTSCHSVCPTSTRNLANVVEKARQALGEGTFEVALLGFDASRDTPIAMSQYARQQGVEDLDWRLLTADPATIDGLTREIGFEFFGSPNGFDHVVQATVIDAGGEVYRQVYGAGFATQLLVEPLMDLVLSREQEERSVFDELVDRVRLFCTSYDPARDAYYFDYSLFVGMIIGGFIILGTIVFMVREYVAARHRRRAT